MPVRSGGVERHVNDIAVRQAAGGHDVTVVARSWYTQNETNQYKGVRITHLPSIPTKNLDAITHTFMSLLYAMFVLRPDIIHVHGVGPSLLAWVPRLFLPRATVISTFHSIDRTQEKWGLVGRIALRVGEWASANLAHETIAVSQMLKHYIAEQYKDSEAVYIPNGVNEITGIEPKVISETYGLTRDTYILSVSRLIPCKGIDLLIRAYQKMDTDLKLVIVGDNEQDPQFVQSLKDIAAATPNILFLGTQHGRALQELYSNASMFVQSSTTEGMSLSLLEAIAAGIPVVASDIPANKEVLEGESANQDPMGLLFASENVEDLCAKLLQMEEQRHAREQKTAQAKESILKDYSWARVAAATLAIYKAAHARRHMKKAWTSKALSR